MNQNSDRRNFIKTAAIGAVATLSIPQIVSAAISPGKHKKIKLEKDDVILFQGDSITDWGRDHKNIVPNSHGMLGSSYAMLAAAHVLLQYSEKNLKIYNRGISGNKVFQLADRWDTDTLAFKPNVLSIHVGVNDYWHTITSGYKGTIDNYIADYHKLIERTKQALPNIKLIICEPFAVKGVKAVDDSWYPAFDLYRKAAQDIATEYNTAFVPWQAITDKALETAPPAYWSLDGVHPSVAGAALMAHAWTETLKG